MRRTSFYRASDYKTSNGDWVIEYSLGVVGPWVELSWLGIVHCGSESVDSYVFVKRILETTSALEDIVDTLEV